MCFTIFVNSVVVLWSIHIKYKMVLRSLMLVTEVCYSLYRTARTYTHSTGILTPHSHCCHSYHSHYRHIFYWCALALLLKMRLRRFAKSLPLGLPLSLCLIVLWLVSAIFFSYGFPIYCPHDDFMCFAGLSVMVRQVNTICCCAVGCHTHTNCHLHDQSVYTTGTVQPIILFFFFIIIVQYMCVSFMRWASVGFTEQIFYVSLPCSSAAGHSNSNMSRPMTVSSPFTLQNGLNIAYQNYHLQY